MKVVALLLSFHILCLALAPPAMINILLPVTNMSKKACCSSDKKQSPPVHQQQKDCCGGICNPFMSCCNGHALLSKSLSLSVPFSYLTQEFNNLSETQLSDYSADTWNPPKS